MTDWGDLSLFSPSNPYPASLQKVTVRTQSKEQCREKFETIGENGVSFSETMGEWMGDNNIVSVSENMICAAMPRTYSCQGDSGGPLTVLGLNSRQVGVVTWVSDRHCTDPRYPAVYTRVTSFLPWIRQRMKPAQGNNILSHPHSPSQL